MLSLIIGVAIAILALTGLSFALTLLLSPLWEEIEAYDDRERQ